MVPVPVFQSAVQASLIAAPSEVVREGDVQASGGFRWQPKAEAAPTNAAALDVRTKS